MRVRGRTQEVRRRDGPRIFRNLDALLSQNNVDVGEVDVRS